MKAIIQVLLAFALIAIGGLKLLGSTPPDAVITGTLAVFAGVLEIGLGLVLLFVAKLRRYVCCSVIVLCLCGLGVNVLFPDRACGCMGSLVGREYLLVVGMLGTLASCWLLLRVRKSSELESRPIQKRGRARLAANWPFRSRR